MKAKILIMSVTLLLANTYIHAVIVGSNESVSIQSHVNFPAADADNSILGFAWMRNGFSLENVATTCIFDSLYPASGNIALNGGTLVLQQDLVLKDLVTLGSFGTIIGNGHNVDVTQAIFTPVAPSGPRVLQNVNLYINSNFTVIAPLHFQGNCTIFGNGNILTLFDGLGFIIVDPEATLTVIGVTITNVQGNNIQCADDTGSIILDNASIIQSGDYTFSTGSMSFFNTVDWQGSFTFFYDSAQSSTIQSGTILSESVLHMFNGITFSIGKIADDASVQPLVFTDRTSVLYLDDATLDITQYGAQFTKGTIEISDNATINVASTVPAFALTLGDGIQADDPAFLLNASCLLNFATGLVVFDVVGATLFEAKEGSQLIRGASSIFLFEQSRVYENLTVTRTLGETTIFGPGTTLLFENSTLLNEDGSFLLTGFSIDSATNLLNGNQSIFINSGTLNLITLVTNTNNTLGGSGVIDQPVILQDSNAQINFNFNGRFDADIILNGGTISLENSVAFGHDFLISGSGVVNLDNHSLILGDLDLTFTHPLFFDGITGVITLQADVFLSNTWTFSGNCFITGNGNTLNIQGGAIIIEQGSTLEFRNITVQGISGNNIRCADEAGVIVLDNVTWFQDGYYTFTQGAIIFDSAIYFQGVETFAYQSMQTSTVLINSIVTFDALFTFSYDPGTSPNLLEFSDLTSIMTFNGSILHATAQGLNLTKGTCLIESGCVFYADNFITVGDCFNPVNDFACGIAPNAQLEIGSGNFNYKNVNASSWIMQGSTPILRIDGGAALNLYTVLNLQSGSAVFGNNATLGNQANLIGSSSQEGTLNFITLPPC